MRALSTRPFLSATVLFFMASCVPDCQVKLDTAAVLVDSGTATNDDTGSGGDTAGDTSVEDPIGVDGSIQGTITVTLFELDGAGDVSTVNWEDSCFGATFPYGDILITAYTTDEETGEETYYGDYTIYEPSTDSSQNTYSIEILTEDADEIYLYAVLDKWDDHIIGASDPVGIYGDPISVGGGDLVDGVNIEILTEYWAGFDGGTGTGSGSGSGPCPDCPPHWGEGGGWYWDGTNWVYEGSSWYWDGSGWVNGWGGMGSGGGSGHGGGWTGTGGCSGDVTVGGDLSLTVPYNGTGSDVATILYWPGTGEPWSTDLGISVTGGSSGATGLWGHAYRCNSGRFSARGAWDDNGNGMYDPTDTWGQPVDDHGTALNTINFGETDTTDQVMLIPVEGADFGLIPFVRLSGSVTYQAGSFDDLLAESPSAIVYVAALKYPVNGDLDASIMEEAYDFEAYTPEDLAGQSSLPYTMLVPSEVVTYLWAGVDMDANDMLNEPGEPVSGMPGDSNNRVSTGSTSQSGLDLQLVSLETDGG